MSPLPTAALLLLSFLSLSLTTTTAFDYSSYIGKTTGGNAKTVPNRYIVQFNSSSAMSAIAKRSGDEGVHGHVYRQLEERGVGYEVKYEYNSGVFMGASLSISNGTGLAQLATLSGVVSFLPVQYVARPDAYESTYDFLSNGASSYPGFSRKQSKRDVVAGEKRIVGENPMKMFKRAPQGPGGPGGPPAPGGPAGGPAGPSGGPPAPSGGPASGPPAPGQSSSSVKTSSASTSSGKTGAMSSSSSASSSATTVKSSTVSVSTGKSSTASAKTSGIISSSTTCSAIPAATTVPYSANPMSGVDKLHDAGYFGAGSKVGVIDSGVDYTHPALGGCFGAGCKIAGGYDYVGDNFNGSNSPMPDSDPLDQCYGHGTFVAGVIGASLPNTYNVSGVASSASQYHYRVFSCDGSTTDDIVAQAMMDAYNAGMDVINLSLGENTGWTESMLAVIASNIADAGVVMSIAIGDEGQDGAFYAQSPAVGASAAAVGSVDNYVYPAQNATVNTTCSQITYYGYKPIGTAGPYPIVTFSNVYPNNEDACPVSDAAAALDYSGKVVLIQRSTDTANCGQLQQVKNAYYAGAEIVLVSNLDGMAPLYPGSYPLGYAYISQADGKMLFDQVQAGLNPAISFPFNPVVVANNFTGGYTSVFSALGPTWDLYLKPQVLTPGMYIVSTVPVEGGSYAIASGSSFSTPFLTGIAAVYKAAKGTKGPVTLQALQIYSNPVSESASQSDLLTVAMAGAGLQQAYQAIVQGDTLISPSQIALNDSAYFNGVQTLTVTNTGKSRITYKLKHLPADTAYNFNASSYDSNYSPLPTTKAAASVWFSQESLTLAAGASSKVVVYFSAPGRLNAQRFPIYSGFIQLSGGANPVTVPYLGVAATMKNLPLLDNTANFMGTKLPQIVNGNGSVQTSQETYTLANGDAPTVMYRLFGGSRVVLIDLVNSTANLGFNPTASKRDFEEEVTLEKRGNNNNNGNNSVKNEINNILSSIWAYLQSLLNGGNNSGGNTNNNTFAKVPTLGNLYEADYVSRNIEANAPYDDGNQINSYAFTGTFANGTTVPNGNYKFLLRVLRITGNPAVESDYDSWVSPVITVQK